MPIIIGANNYQLWGKLISLIVIIGILGLLIDVTIYLQGNNVQNPWLLPIFGLLFLILIIVFLIQLIFLPIGISIDISSKEIIINYLILRSKYLQLSDIASYTTTSIFTRSSEYKGVLIYLNNGKKILLSDFNLRDCSPFISFLEDAKAKFDGKEKFKFIRYYTQCL